MMVKLILRTPSGSVETQYVPVAETPGGYADLRTMMHLIPDDWLLGDGDTITMRRLDQLEDDELTEEDKRQLGLR